MLIAYKPSHRHSWSSAPTDISRDISKALDTDTTLASRIRNDLKSTSGKTHTEFEMPEAAPLIFPHLDAAAAEEGGEEEEAGKKEPTSAFKKSGRFVSDYLDRRAQAVYNAENSSLSTGTPPEFRSRYADPTHPASSGSLIGLVTGGKVDRRDKSQSRKAEKGKMGLIRGSVGYLRREKPAKKMLRQVSWSDLLMTMTLYE